MAKKPKCRVTGCGRDAAVEVILYDVYTDRGEVFYEQDFTCPYLSGQHLVENEQKARGVRQPRGRVSYPFTNRQSAQGFTVYRPLGE